ncbi:DUF3800 domain-containing protein [Fulvivirga lutea]|uniref:DUF3800 domain-containing protein n=1 Tax=Fulvivirga lutea TaxID=2810512 RepID=A0A974WE12_9BACT|nr:DUF3800 domain-containing protein [Fulvivirga lutea]QSE96508.1 DUF3800 domain-containing protein [Fulvivirga lutea]
MAYIYYDESKHDQAGFYLGAFVYSKYDLNKEISNILKETGLDPNEIEFKSRLANSNPELKIVREKLRRLFSKVKVFIVVSNNIPKEFAEATELGLKQLLEYNKEEIEDNVEIFLDEGIFRKEHRFEGVKQTINIEQDSMKIKGIQLADLVASVSSTMLKEQLGLINKKVKAGPKSGYDPEMEIEIGFELWAGLRFRFFGYPPPNPDKWESQLDFVSVVGKKGLFISDNCDPKIKQAAYDRFGEMYLGCIH